MRVLYDSVTASDIPQSCDMVGGYIDGTYKWSDADWALFPDKVHVRIAALASTNDGEVGDVERGDMTPQEGVGWVQARRAAGVDPSLYVGAYNWGAVAQAFRDAGEPEPHYWVANYDNNPVIPEGAIGKQYANATFTGGHYDASVVEDFWPGVDPMVSEEELAYRQNVRETVDAIKAVLASLQQQIVDVEAKAVVEAQLGVLEQCLKPRP